MKRKKDIFKALENADDELLETMTNDFDPLSDEQKKRILLKSEEKLEQRKNIPSDIDSSDNVVTMTEIENKNTWYRQLGKIAACFVGLIAVGAAVILALNGVKTDVPLSREEISVNYATPDPAEKNSNPVVQSCAADKKESSEESQAEQTSSKSHEISCESSRAADTSADSDTETERITGTESYTDTNQDEIDIAIDETDYDKGYTGKNRVLAVTEDMTYGEVIELLGAPDDLLIQDGFAMYRVESNETDRILYLFYDNPEDVIGKNGHQLFEEAIPIDQMYFDLENHTFECVVADIHDGGSIRVSCPQYEFMCADFRYTDDPSSMNIKLGDRLMVTYTGYALTVYPCIIQVTSVEVVNDKSNWAIEE